MQFLVAAEGDVDTIANTIALAFRDDPVWGPALAAADGTTAHLARFWRHFVVEPTREGTVFMTEGAAAVAVWIGPGGTELSEHQEAEVNQLVAATLPPARVAAFDELSARFDLDHPRDVPHAYLSLLATHPDHRGQGIAQQLLATNLREWDRQGVPSYLESTNPGNDHRYERAGFRRFGEFRAPLNDAPISTMWRAVESGD